MAIEHVVPWSRIRASQINNVIDAVNQNTEDIEDIVQSSSVVPFQHTQSVPSSTWSGTHGLNRIPRAVVIDSSGQVMLADVTFPDLNTFLVVHGQPTTGSIHFL